MIRASIALWLALACVFALTATGVLAPSLAMAQSPPPITRDLPSAKNPNAGSGEGMVTLNFLNSNLEDVIKGVSVMTDLRFLLSPDLKSKNVSLITQQAIPTHQVYGVLLTMLRAYRLSAVEADGIINIVPETEAWSQVKPKSPNDPDSQLVSKNIKLNFITASVAANILRPLLSQKGFPLVPNANNNTLLIVDYAANIHNLETIVQSLDQSDQILPVIFPVNHLSALDAENALRTMLQSPPIGSSAGFATPVSESIYSDVPNNRLLIRADPKRLIYIAQLLAFIDVPRKSANLINIYPLKYTNAEKMAKTLQALLSNKSGTSSTGNSPRANTATPNNTATPATGNTSSSGDILDLSVSGVNIQADASTNSLIIAAPENLYRNLVDIVRKLDVRRKQVFVEILIADVSGERVNELGVQWMAGKGYSSQDSAVVGATNYDTGIASVAQNPLSLGKGITIGVVKGTINVPGVGSILNLGMLARALETRLNANILSSPNLLVLNNEESKLIVGTNVPVVTGQYTTSGASTNPFQTIERKDVGVNLKIKPQIMDSGAILLDIYQEVSDILSTTANGPTTSKRSIESRIMLDDGQIMVLGGLISEKQNDDVSQVPFLGQIPLLGRLFSYTKKTHTKSNLMLFIRPTVIVDESDAARYSDKKYQDIYNMMPYEGGDLKGLFGERAPVLPSKEPTAPLLPPSLNPVEQPLPAQKVNPPLNPPVSPFSPEPQGKPAPSTPQPTIPPALEPQLSAPHSPPPVGLDSTRVIFVPNEGEGGEERLAKKREMYRKKKSELDLQLFQR